MMGSEGRAEEQKRGGRVRVSAASWPKSSACRRHHRLETLKWTHLELTNQRGSLLNISPYVLFKNFIRFGWEALGLEFVPNLASIILEHFRRIIFSENSIEVRKKNFWSPLKCDYWWSSWFLLTAAIDAIWWELLIANANGVRIPELHMLGWYASHLIVLNSSH